MAQTDADFLVSDLLKALKTLWGMAMNVNAERDRADFSLDRLVQSAYTDLHRIARRQMRGERRGHTLQTTALVNEAYLRLLELREIKGCDRSHFLAVAAGTMRRILVDQARASGAQKRGGDALQITLDENLPDQNNPVDVIALDSALNQLASEDEKLTKLIELRYFAGLTIAEAAQVLEISPATAKRKWRFAQAWLFRALCVEDR